MLMPQRFCPTKWWPFVFTKKMPFQIFHVMNFQDVSIAVTASSYWVCDNAANICHLWLILWRNVWYLDCVGPAVNDKCPLLSISVAVSGLGGPSVCTADTWGSMSWRVIQPMNILHCSSSVQLPIAMIDVDNAVWLMYTVLPNDYGLRCAVQFPYHCWSPLPTWTQCCMQVLSLHK